MKIQQKLYQEIKNIILEYEKILELDKLYMNDFLKENHDELNQISDDTSNFTNLLDENYINQNINIYIERKCIKLYRKLAKILHPDKNKKNSDLFIKINFAYRNNDYITLFMYSYEFNINFILNDDEINTIKNAILEKKNKIEEIQNKIHWNWHNCKNNLQRENIKRYIINNL